MDIYYILYIYQCLFSKFKPICFFYFFYKTWIFLGKTCENEFISALFPAQPAGVPEILKKSLHSCSVRGGEEVFIIGKNFLKDTKVIFQENVSGKS